MTAAIIKSIKHEDDIFLGYKRAVFADSSCKDILDHFDIYRDCSFEQTNAAEPCILRRGTQLCEKCQLKFEFRNIVDSKLAPKDMDCLSCISSAVLDQRENEVFLKYTQFRSYINRGCMSQSRDVTLRFRRSYHSITSVNIILDIHFHPFSGPSRPCIHSRPISLFSTYVVRCQHRCP